MLSRSYLHKQSLLIKHASTASHAHNNVRHVVFLKPRVYVHLDEYAMQFQQQHQHLQDRPYTCMLTEALETRVGTDATEAFE